MSSRWISSKSPQRWSRRHLHWMLQLSMSPMVRSTAHALRWGKIAQRFRRSEKCQFWRDPSAVQTWLARKSAIELDDFPGNLHGSRVPESTLELQRRMLADSRWVWSTSAFLMRKSVDWCWCHAYPKLAAEAKAAKFKVAFLKSEPLLSCGRVWKWDNSNMSILIRNMMSNPADLGVSRYPFLRQSHLTGVSWISILVPIWHCSATEKLEIYQSKTLIRCQCAAKLHKALAPNGKLWPVSPNANFCVRIFIAQIPKQEDSWRIA